MSLVETGRVEEIGGRIAADYERQTGIKPSVLTSRPSRGAHVVK